MCFGGGSFPSPPPTPPLPDPLDPRLEETNRKRRLLDRERRGRTGLINDPAVGIPLGVGEGVNTTKGTGLT